jgi:hypothetical protein
MPIDTYTRQVMPREMARTQASAAAFGGNQSGTRAIAGALGDLSGAIGAVEQRLTEVRQKREKVEHYERWTQHQADRAAERAEMSKQDYDPSVDLGQEWRTTEEEALKEFEKGVPDHLKDQFRMDAAQYLAQVQLDGLKEQSGREALRIRTSWENTVQLQANLAAARPGNRAAALNTLRAQVDALPLPAEEREALFEGAKDGVNQAAASAMATNAPGAFLAQAQAGQWNDVPDLVRYQNAAKNTIKAQEAAARAEASRQAAQKKESADLLANNLETAIKLDPTPEESAALFGQIEQNKDVLGQENYNRLLVQWHNKTKEQREGAAQAQIGHGLLTGEIPFGGTKEQRDAIDAYTEAAAPQVASLPPEQQVVFFTRVITTAGYVPEYVKQQVSVAARSQSEEQVAAATMLIDSVERVNPYLVEQIATPGVLERLQMIKDRTDAGIPFSEASKAVDEALDPGNRVTRERLKEELRPKSPSYQSGIDYRGKAIEALDRYILPFAYRVTGRGPSVAEGGRVRPPDASVDMLESAYTVAYQDAYMRTGDKTQAGKSAEHVVRSQFYASTINGRTQVMRYAPELVYKNSDGTPADWLRGQMVEFTATRMGEMGITEADLKSGNLNKDLYLMIDPYRTPETFARGAPEYKLFVQRKDGSYAPLLGANEYWVFDQEAQNRGAIFDAMQKIKEKNKVQEEAESILFWNSEPEEAQGIEVI